MRIVIKADWIGELPGDYYPLARRAEIDAINPRVYPGLNNGVYRQASPPPRRPVTARTPMSSRSWTGWKIAFSESRFLLGDQPLECDGRLFTSPMRFDPVYVGPFKSNVCRLIDYPNLWGYTRDLYQWPGVRETVDFRHIKGHD